MDKSKSTAIVAGFLQYLKKENNLNLLPEIVTALESKIAEDKLVAEVLSSSELTKNQEKEVQKILLDRFGIKSTIFEVDTTLIGGIKIKIGDQVLDLSVQNKLDHLNKSI